MRFFFRSQSFTVGFCGVKTCPPENLWETQKCVALFLYSLVWATKLPIKGRNRVRLICDDDSQFIWSMIKLIWYLIGQNKFTLQLLRMPGTEVCNGWVGSYPSLCHSQLVLMLSWAVKIIFASSKTPSIQLITLMNKHISYLKQKPRKQQDKQIINNQLQWVEHV